MKFPKEHAITIAMEIPGQTWASELGWLYDTMATSKRHAEIGTYAGRSLFVASHGMESGEIVTVDARYESHRGIPIRFLREQTQVTIGHCNPGVTVTSIEQTSFTASREVTGEFDSIFIDGDHQYESVLVDISVWLPKVMPGGIICGHDYWPNHWGVMEAVNEVFGGKHEVVPETRLWLWRKPIA